MGQSGPARHRLVSDKLEWLGPFLCRLKIWESISINNQSAGQLLFSFHILVDGARESSKTNSSVCQGGRGHF